MNLFASLWDKFRTSALRDQERFYRLIFEISILVILVSLPLLSFGYGITWDEWMQGHYGKLVIRYLISGGTNHDFMDFAETMYLYGGLFDTITGLVYAVLFDSIPHFAYSGLHDTLNGISKQDVYTSGFYETRHVMNSLFGFLAILFTGLLSKELRSWRTACIAILLLTLSPRFLGGIMNNPKDIPFASAYIFSFYAMARFIKELPKPGIGTLIMNALAIALAIGIRIGGLILIFYLMGFSFVVWMRHWFVKKETWNPFRLGIYVFSVSICGYLGGLIFWPYGQLNPLLNPFRTFKAFSNFTGASSQILFEGKLIPNTNLPWYYIPKWIAISNPLLVLLGFILFLILFRKVFSISNRRCLWMTLFSFIFPVITVIVQRPVLYDAWRHFLFVYPPIVIISALALETLSGILKKLYLRITYLVMVIILGLQPLIWMFQNHPFEDVYFNSFVGGINGANGFYQTDYWGNSLRKASEWLGHYNKLNNPGRVVLVHADGNLMSTYPYLKHILGEEYFPYAQVPAEIKKVKNPDYGIFLNKDWPREKILGAWPPTGTVYQVKADATTLCAVVKNAESNLK